ncbi:MAG: rhomboid family intramembrane serine protease [Phycisphaerales bacterium]|nr:rhomboid family intramembrane serine protease [Phycisphaerales bacterium]
MGIYDRDYYRSPPTPSHARTGLSRAGMWSITTWLIILNVAVFLIQAFIIASRQNQLLRAGIPLRFARPAFRDPVLFYGAFTIHDAFLHYQFWRVIICQFLHANLWHLLVNMVGLYIFGPIVELNLGRWRYSFFYLLCGIAGPVMYTLLWAAARDTPLVGASAGIFGILLAAAYLAPDRLIYVYFFEVRLKYFAWVMMGVAAYTVLFHGQNAGGQAAHLGGGLLGWLLIRFRGVRRKKPVASVVTHN